MADCRPRCRFVPGDVVSLGITGLLMRVDGAHLNQVSVSWWSGTTRYTGKFEAHRLIHRQPVSRRDCVCGERGRD